MQRRVDRELGVHATDAVLLGADGQVVPGAEVLHMHPRRPAGGVDAALAAGLELAGSDAELLPGLGRGVGVQPGLLEGVLVDVEHRRGRIEGHRQHIALAVGVVARHRRDIRLRVEGLARILHQLVDRLDRALGRHHRGGAHLEHLHDVRRIAGPEGGDRGGHRLGVAALVDRHHLVVLLAGIEAGGHLAHAVAERTGHRMPPLDFCRCLGLGRPCQGCTQGSQGGHGGDESR